MSFSVLTKLRLSLSMEDCPQHHCVRSCIHDGSVYQTLSATFDLQGLFIERDGDIRLDAFLRYAQRLPVS